MFDTGFHLYYCAIHRDSGLVATDSLEVRGWHWLPLEDFHSATWRYQGQGEILWNLLTGKPGTEPAAQNDPGE
mgnify:FL=1